MLQSSSMWWRRRRRRRGGCWERRRGRRSRSDSPSSSMLLLLLRLRPSDKMLHVPTLLPPSMLLVSVQHAELPWPPWWAPPMLFSLPARLLNCLGEGGSRSDYESRFCLKHEEN